MKPSLGISSLLLFSIFQFSPVINGENYGKLTEAENIKLLRTCGRPINHARREVDGIALKYNGSYPKYLTAISSRHLVMDPRSKLRGLEFEYNRDKCVENVQRLHLNISDELLGVGDISSEAYYIGSCEDTIPRGFVILEHHVPSPYRKWSPHCLPTSPIENGTELAIHVEEFMPASARDRFEFLKTFDCEDAQDEVCTDQLVVDYGGPVLPSEIKKKVLVGHAFAHTASSVKIIPIHRYLKQICDVSGICVEKVIGGEESSEEEDLNDLVEEMESSGNNDESTGRGSSELDSDDKISIGENYGKLTEAENKDLLGNCGRPSTNKWDVGALSIKHRHSYPKDFPAISSRHLIVDLESKFMDLEYEYNRDQCFDNVQRLNLKIPARKPGDTFSGPEPEAYYIGSCEDTIPRGFVILEYHLPSPLKFLPYCLSNYPIANGTNVYVWDDAKNGSIVSTKIFDCEDAHADEMCTEQMIPDFGGPVSNLNIKSRRLVGHAFANIGSSTRIIPIHRYLKQICDVSGICVESSAEKNSPFLPPLRSRRSVNSQLESMEFDEPVIHVNFPESSEVFPNEPKVMSSETYINSEVINGGESSEEEEFNILVDEIESSGIDNESTGRVSFDFGSDDISSNDIQPEQFSHGEETTGEKVLFLFKSDEEQMDSTDTIVMSAVPEQQISQEAPQESTIVRAEPFSAVIIPLSTEQPNNTSCERSEFSTPEELCIAVLIMVALMLFVLMCRYGCLGNSGAPYHGQSNMSERQTV